MSLSGVRLSLASALFALAGVASLLAAPLGTLEGHLSIVAPAEVDLAEGKPPTGVAYAKYPLIILAPDGKEVTRLVADASGNYRVTLPPGDYVLDAQGRTRGHLRTKPQRFTVVANQTVHVDLNIDTGIR